MDDGLEQLEVAGDDDVRVVLAVHRRRGIGAMGGFRLVQGCPTEAEALAGRLARLMTIKAAWAGLRVGGMKLVAITARDDPALRRRAVELAAALMAPHDDLWTGKDLGTGPHELELLATLAPGRVVGLDPATDPSWWTALGVQLALSALAIRLLHDRAPTVLIEGLGAVGGRLAEMLARRGWRVLGVDPRPEARREAAAAGVEVLGATVDDVRGPVPVWAPCAGSGTVTHRRLVDLGVRLVCGSANDPWGEPPERLVGDGRVWLAPDPVVNRGGLVAVVSEIDPTVDPAERVAAIPGALERIEDACRLRYGPVLPTCVLAYEPEDLGVEV